ncbi:MAG TPA: hypothetical protein PKE26_15050, partial [Kiritimatiellia bacterium]|nr:hypothetical protein [Kiritimatiellia bacterium]HMP00414.1 hypothetical protein [Kiritimatiellia bacterium]HMP97833.1 hypothetical protein [Kiritimatiellia bacterium]
KKTAIREVPSPRSGSVQHADYAKRLGDNPFDRYAVQHQMRVLFNIPFMRQTNPGGWDRFNREAGAFERSLPPDLQEIVRHWQGRRPHAGGARPITGMIARGLMRRGQFAEAQPLLEVAQRAVMPYTSWHMEYVYFDLACREKLQGRLTENDRELARKEIDRGKILLSYGHGESGLTERYTGRLHQLLGEFEEAIPYLLASRSTLSGFDLVAADQALFVSYQQTGRIDAARELAEFGVQNSGQYAAHYRQLLVQLERSDHAEPGADIP